MRAAPGVAEQDVASAEDLLARPISTKTLFPALLLCLLAKKPDHGYGVMERMEEACGSFLSVSTKRIYPVLQRLESEGLVFGTWDHPTKRMRRTYSVTVSGREHLRKFQREMWAYFESLMGSIAALRDLVCLEEAEQNEGAR